MYSRGRLLEFNKASLSSHHQKRFLSPLKQVQQLSWLSSHHAGRESFGLQLRLLLEIHIALREWDCSPFFSRASILGKCHLVNQFESDLNQEYWTFFLKPPLSFGEAKSGLKATLPKVSVWRGLDYSSNCYRRVLR